jgi:hypothetical protein
MRLINPRIWAPHFAAELLGFSSEKPSTAPVAAYTKTLHPLPDDRIARRFAFSGRNLVPCFIDHA